MPRPVNRPTLSISKKAASAPDSDRSPPLHHGDLQRVGGLPAVSAVFQCAPDRVERLFYEPRLAQQVQPFCQIMAQARKPYRQVSADELVKIGGSAVHGGVVAVVHPKPVLTFSPSCLAQWAADGKALVILDGVGNPHNLGAIARTMAFFGFNRLLLSDHPKQASLSGAALRIAEGGLEWIATYQCGKMTDVIAALKPHYHVIGTALGAHTSPRRLFADIKRPIALILGNEEHGLPQTTMAACDDIVTIAGSGQIQSLNVSSSTAILLSNLHESGR